MSRIFRVLRNKFVLGLVVVVALVAAGITIAVATNDSGYVDTPPTYTPSPTYSYDSDTSYDSSSSDDSDSSGSDSGSSSDDSGSSSSGGSCEVEEVPGSSSSALSYKSGGGDVFSINLKYGRAYAANYSLNGDEYVYDPKIRTEPVFFERGGMSIEIYVDSDYGTVVKVCGDYSQY